MMTIMILMKFVMITASGRAIRYQRNDDVALEPRCKIMCRFNVNIVTYIQASESSNKSNLQKNIYMLTSQHHCE